MDILAAISLGSELPSTFNTSNRVSRNDNLLSSEMYRSIICMSLYQILIMVILMYFGGLMFFTEPLDLVSLPIRDVKTQEPTDRMKLNTILFHTFILMSLFNKINCKAATLEKSVLMSNKIFWVILIAEFGV